AVSTGRAGAPAAAGVHERYGRRVVRRLVLPGPQLGVGDEVAGGRLPAAVLVAVGLAGTVEVAVHGAADLGAELLGAHLGRLDDRRDLVDHRVVGPQPVVGQTDRVHLRVDDPTLLRVEGER